ncbi:transposase family protein [Streptomyces hypolithicus]
MLEELAPPWAAARASALHVMRGGPRKRAEGAGRKPRLVFTDRLAATLVHLRLGLPHAALAELYGVDRSTVSAAIREVRPLLAARGFAIPNRPGLRIRTLDDLFAYADAEGVDIRLDGTEVQVRRPRAGRPGRKAFVSGKKKQNTIKTTTFSDHQGRTLFSGVVRPGRMHDQTAVRTEGIAEQFRLHPYVHAEVDSGYQGLAKEFPSQERVYTSHELLLLPYKRPLVRRGAHGTYVVLGDHQPERAVAGARLTYRDYKIWRLTPGKTFDFRNRPVCGYYLRSVVDGRADANLYSGTPASTCTASN